jgi:LacI family transcriptional regulator
MKKATINDVARKACVSVATVSRALNKGGLVSDETRLSIAKAMEEVGYNKSSKTVFRNEGKSGLIYFIMKSVNINTYAQMLDFSIIQAAEKWNMKIVSSSLNPEIFDGSKANSPVEAHFIMHIQEAIKLGVCGIIISGFDDATMNHSISLLLQTAGIPVVFINRNFDYYSFNCVCSEAAKGTYLAVRHLLENKRKNLLMLALSWQKKRSSGLLQAIEDWNGPKPEYSIVELRDDAIERVYEETKKILEKKPGVDGIHCSSDELAAGVLRYLIHVGKKIPDEVELIGYNDNLAPLLTPPISSVRIPIEEIAELAIEMIAKDEPKVTSSSVKTVILDPGLIIR